MRKPKQETREEKISRCIRNISKALEDEPILDCLVKKRAELEAKLRTMPLEERRALVPWEETERERKQNIATLTELIADDEKELASKQEAVQEVKRRIAEFRRCLAKLERRAPPGR